MLQNKIKVGDYILVTSGTSTAVAHGFIGKILEVVTVDTFGDSLPFQVINEKRQVWWVNGVPATDLIKALV